MPKETEHAPYSVILVAFAVRGPEDEALHQIDAILDAMAIQDDLENYAGCETLASAAVVYERPDSVGALLDEVAECANEWLGDELAHSATGE